MGLQKIYPVSEFAGINTSHTKPAGENISFISLTVACIYVLQTFKPRASPGQKRSHITTHMQTGIHNKLSSVIVDKANLKRKVSHY